MRRHWSTLLFCTVGALSGLTPCAAGDLDHVRVQLKWLHQFQFAGYYAAIEQGFYRDAGLEVELIEGSPEVDPARIVLEGGAEFGVGTPEILLSLAEGKPLVVLGVIFQHSPYGILSLQESGISSVKDLFGKRIMIEPQAAELYAYLRREGVPSEKLEILPHTFSETDLVEGIVDAMSAYITTEPFPLRQAGIAYSFFSPRASGIDFYGDVFFTTREQVKRHPQRVRGFYEATVRGWKYAMENEDEIVDLILAKYPTVMSRGGLLFEAEKMRGLMHPEIVPIGYMYEGRWRHIMETYRELGMLDEDVDLKSFLYDPDPRRSMAWLYWVSGVAFGLAVLAFAILLPLWRFNLRLRAAKECAEAADQARRDFVATVSHDLRTPVTGIVGFTDLLKSTPLTQEQKEWVNIVESSSNNMIRLIDELLDFSQIEAGQVEIENKEFEIGPLVSEVIRLLEPAAMEKNLSLDLRMDSGVPGVLWGDAARIRQILLNLLGNAVKFTESGGVRLELRRVAPNGAPDGMVEFAVIDTGPGISPEALERLFAPFSQADSSIKHRHGGSGLGLSICKRLANLMGGDVRAESRVGEGSTFRCTLPLLARTESPGAS